MTKYIFVTGGVISGLGKGVTSASIGAILQMLGESKVTIKKLDPYLNVDAGTMNPIEHGEVFVTDDGIETDLDLGYYERFLEISTSKENSSSSGKLFQKLIQKERDGDYLGKTVQMIPHFTDMIKEFICHNTNGYDYIICEIGGSVGDIEAMAFYEAIRQLKNDVGYGNILFVHLTYLLYLSATRELKTKPTQNTIRDLQQYGITPDILICRSEIPIPIEIKKKLSLHTNLPLQNIISAIHATSIYQVPLNFIREGIHLILSERLNIKKRINTLKWKRLNNQITSLTSERSLIIGIIGKYTALNDSYKSLLESIFHAGIYHNISISIEWINSREEPDLLLEKINGIIIPGGFGSTGIETIISLISIARVRKVPTFGICLGMQLMTIEYFRNVLSIHDAGSKEFGNYNHNIITKYKGASNEQMGGTMRLGKHKIKLSNSKVKDIYQSEVIHERHRHRYIISPNYINYLNEEGLNKVGTNIESNIIETVELNHKLHPWYIGCQYHPEYQSSPFNPHPLFLAFIQQCFNNK